MGLSVANLRAKFSAGQLTDEQNAEAEVIGVSFSLLYRDPNPMPPTQAERKESEILRRLAQLEDFYREHEHINIRQAGGVEG